MVSCMPSAAAVCRHIRPKLHTVFSTSLQRLRTSSTLRKRDGLEEINSQVELNRVYHDRSNYKVMPKAQNDGWSTQAPLKLQDRSRQLPILKTTEYNVSPGLPRTVDQPMAWEGQV